jgi:hypothetical protein
MAKKNDDLTNTTPPEEDVNLQSAPFTSAEVAEKDGVTNSNEELDTRTNMLLSEMMPKVDDPELQEKIDLRLGNIKVATGNGLSASANQAIANHEAELAKRTDAEAALKQVEDDTKRMFKEVTVVDPKLYMARERARIAQEARVINTKNTVPGGCFKVGNKWVNANGVEVSAPKGA